MTSNLKWEFMILIKSIESIIISKNKPMRIINPIKKIRFHWEIFINTRKSLTLYNNWVLIKLILNYKRKSYKIWPTKRLTIRQLKIMTIKIFRLLILIMHKLKSNKLTLILLKKNFKILSKTLLLIVIEFFFLNVK